MPPTVLEYDFQYLISNFVYPEHWDFYKKVIKDERMFCTFGIHPRFVSNTSHLLDKLQNLLDLPECVALGEIGINFSRKTTEQQKDAQWEFLDKVLPFAKARNKPVVFHFRVEYGGSDLHSLVRDKFIKTLKIHLGRKFPMHLHCFSGSRLDVAAFEYFTNLKFSIGGTLVNEIVAQTPAERERLLNLRENLEDAIPEIKLDRLMVETDAPGLPPASIYNGPGTLNSPFTISEVIRKLASLRNLPPVVIMELCRKNACDFYRLPQC